MLRRMLLLLPPVGVIAYVIAPVLGERQNAVLIFNLATVLTLLVYGAVLATFRPTPLLPWLLVGVGFASWVAGDILFSAIGGDATVSVADALYGLGYVGFAAAAVVLIRHRLGERDLDSAIDALLIGIACFLLLWIAVISPAWNDPGASQAARIMSALYPLLDALLLFFLLRLALVPIGLQRSGMVLVAALVAILVGDVSYAALQQTGSYVEGPWHADDIMWLVGYALLPLAAAFAARDRRTDAGAPGSQPSRFAGFLAAGIALICLPAMDIAGRFTHRATGVAVHEVAGTIIVALVVLRIVRLHGSLERAFTAVDRQQRYYRGVAEHASDSFVIISPNGQVLGGATTLPNLLGFGFDDVVGTNLITLVHPDDRTLTRALFDDAIAHPGVSTPGEFRATTANGAHIWLEVYCTDLTADPAVGGLVLNAHDVTARKEVEAELEHRALHDAITGLANRALFRDRVERALVRGRADGSAVAVLFCDLDGFKLVNDTIGHEAGDEVLRITASRFANSVRPTDTLARFGGDEFAVLIESDDDPLPEALAVAHRLVAAMGEPVDVRGRAMRVTASIGIAVATTDDARTPADLLRDADTAMYGAKAAGRNRAVVYDAAMGSAVMTRVQLDADLRLAVEHNELELRYQPIVELATGHCTGFEALLRWDHPTRGLLAPDEFIGIAEANGSIVEIGQWVLAEACREARRWEPAPDGTPRSVSVNVSGVQLLDDGFTDAVEAALVGSGLPASALHLEITESTLVEHTEAVTGRLGLLKVMGVRIVIDDFGVGQSSLAYLSRFPVDVIKLDRSFVEGIVDTFHVPALIVGILELARKLGITVVAEGIETTVQRDALINEACGFGQGYLFARPVDATAVARMLATAAQPVAR